MSHIFISYSRKDLDFAQKIVDALAANDLDTWIDWNSISSGEKWREEIFRGIEEADAFLFLISPDSVISEMCNEEIAHAVRNGKRIVTLLIRDTNTNAIPKSVSEIQWIKSRDERDDFEKAIAETRKTIHTDYEWLKYHTRLQVKALEWERTKDDSRLLHGKELREAESLLTIDQIEPQSTELQRHFIFTGRQYENKKRRQVISVLAVGILAVLGISVIAILQWQHAEEQAQIALARKLATQAQAIFATGYSNQSTAVQLAIQSVQLIPLTEATLVLQNNTLAHPIVSFTHNNVTDTVVFSPNGNLIAATVDFNTVVVWEAMTGKELVHMSNKFDIDKISFSPDGKYIISVAYNTIFVWEALTGREVAHMSHNYQITDVAFSTNGKVVSADSHSIIIWEVTTGKEVTRLSSHYYQHVNVVVFSSSNQFVASGGCDSRGGGDGGSCEKGSACVWDVYTGKEVSCIIYDGDVFSIAFSPDEKNVVSGGCDDAGCNIGSTRVWEASTGKEISRNANYSGAVTSVHFNPNGKYIVSESCFYYNCLLEKKLSLLESTTGNNVFNYGTAPIAFSIDGKYVVAVSYSDNQIAIVTEVNTNEEIARINLDMGINVYSFSFSPNGKYLVSQSLNTAIVWETATGQEIVRMPFNTTNVSITFNPDSQYLLSIGCDGNFYGDNLICNKRTIRLWGIVAGNKIAKIAQDEMIYSIDFSSDSSRVVSAGCDSRDENYLCVLGTSRTWKISTGEEISHLNGIYNVVSTSSDGKNVASGGCYIRDESSFCLQGVVIVWEASTGKELARMIHENTSVTKVAISQDGKYVVSGGYSTKGNPSQSSLIIWDIAKGEKVSNLNPDGILTSVAFSPNGQYVITESNIINQFTNKAQLWETITGREFTVTTDLNYEVHSVAFSSDNQYLVSGGCEKTTSYCSHGIIQVLEPATGKKIAFLPLDDRNVVSVSFVSNTKYITSLSYNPLDSSNVRLWNSNNREISRINFEHEPYNVILSQDSHYVLSKECYKMNKNNECTQTIIQIWELKTRKELTNLVIDGEVTFIAFSPNNKYLIYTSGNNVSNLLLWRPEDLIEINCLSLSRNFSLTEWQQYVGPEIPYQLTCNPSLYPNAIIPEDAQAYLDSQ